MRERNVTRADIAQALNAKLRFTKTESLKLIDHVFSELTDALKNSKEVKIPFFGVFFARMKKERIGRNPKTMEAHKISARKVVGFRVSRLMKERVNMYVQKKTKV